METIRSDITVVGAGVAGLWTTKELVDRGYSVTLLEKEGLIAQGPSIRNEGWLHAGTYHSVAIKNDIDAANVVERTIYGHNAIHNFAPEVIDHSTSFCYTGDDENVEKAMIRWPKMGVEFREINKNILTDNGVDIKNVSAAFEVEDKSVNTNQLYRKLAAYIIDKGGQIITNAHFTAHDDMHGTVDIEGDRYAVDSDKIVITAGGGLRDMFTAVSGSTLQMRFYKAHLLVGPRLSEDNLFSLDIGEAGIMNHGDASVVGINRDGIQINDIDYEVVEEKEALIHGALSRSLVGYKEGDHRRRMIPVACCKPDIYSTIDDTQNLNVQTMHLSDMYIGALPGKMTESPYLAHEIADTIASDTGRIKRRRVCSYIARRSIDVALRPADVWMNREIQRG